MDATISNSDDETSLANLKAAVAAATGAETGNGDEKFVLICYSGKKYAEAATNLLQQMGVPAANLYTLEGGQNGWACWRAVKAPRPLRRKQKPLPLPLPRRWTPAKSSSPRTRWKP